ncbi:MAG: Uma2 family endonuclease [Armatimonadetes bacterium]|nr:Uma2 family endonuclease [Armatimonadota bacterium]
MPEFAVSSSTCGETIRVTILLDLNPYVQLTEDQFFDLCQRHPFLKLERTPRGEIVIMPPCGGETGSRNTKLIQRLANWAEADGGGVAFDSNTGFRLPKGGERSPDAAWVARRRWESLLPEDRRKFPPLCPDFVVELMSPSDSLREIQAKMLEYLENGARLGWLLDPETGQALIYRPGRAVEVQVHPRTLSGEDVLVGFVLDLDGIL